MIAETRTTKALRNVVLALTLNLTGATSMTNSDTSIFSASGFQALVYQRVLSELRQGENWPISGWTWPRPQSGL